MWYSVPTTFDRGVVNSGEPEHDSHPFVNLHYRFFDNLPCRVLNSFPVNWLTDKMKDPCQCAR